MLARRMAIGVIGDLYPGQVADILAERQLALDVGARDRLVAVILLAREPRCWSS